MKNKCIKIYNKLPESAKFIRKKVFVEEQGFDYEFDDIDLKAIHIVIYEEENACDKKPIATCRFFCDDDGKWLIGRIAVLKEKRGEHIGALLIDNAEKQIRELGGISVKIHAQCRARGFYEKQGYVAVGNIDEDEGIAHIWMFKDI